MNFFWISYYKATDFVNDLWQSCLILFQLYSKHEDTGIFHTR